MRRGKSRASRSRNPWSTRPTRVSAATAPSMTSSWDADDPGSFAAMSVQSGSCLSQRRSSSVVSSAARSSASARSRVIGAATRPSLQGLGGSGFGAGTKAAYCSSQRRATTVWVLDGGVDCKSYTSASRGASPPVSQGDAVLVRCRETFELRTSTPRSSRTAQVVG